MIVNNVTIGADPELFIINEKTNKVISAVGMIPGKKGEPYKADDMPEGFGLETDNILAEFNIPPVRDVQSFVNNIEYMKSYINKFVKEINPDYGILCAASKTVEASQLKSKQAKEFGCDVDYNAYTEDANPKPNGAKTNTRSAGFHLHLGYDDNNIDTSVTLIKYLDKYVGLPSVLKDNDTRRRSLYGKAGCFRLTPYGTEYRTLSSAMMRTPELIEFVYNQVLKAIDAYNHREPLRDTSYIVQAINESDSALAKTIIEKYNII